MGHQITCLGFSLGRLGLAVGLWAFVAGVCAQPAQGIDAQEQRRAQERERSIRQQQEQAPDVRLQGGVATETARLPATETPCFTIRTVRLRVDDGTQGFDWLLTALSGTQADDSPLGHCLGAQGISLLIKRVQDALTARGFVTSRVLAEPQDLKSGELTLTVLPGRLGAVRFASDGEVRTTARNAVPEAPGNLLNLRDVEQALENFKRVPTAEAHINEMGGVCRDAAV